MPCSLSVPSDRLRLCDVCDSMRLYYTCNANKKRFCSTCSSDWLMKADVWTRKFEACSHTAEKDQGGAAMSESEGRTNLAGNSIMA